ncbi:Snf7-domain-containing protein [Metschnikowia bicuspidata var. bicuspidata NRRL YB-4993]|uniref:Vacuolar-sorting protein SNF7 n=1 Tax=Metschnikowia bicuspidata var. bicuspidata NRRL YB-4993 TaxID=869754 RepID=A0A1A0H9Q2_9ASCO|nr:Snf7-domain-containing protein [Metschnikowia bicuspidata var. bicuspidata NRRL YB-4993]OBA20720.1 Snf7-domain-containing protein [Metschnikowia bicuspidata var. bicuspidata NRRL YB-4993]
MWSYMFGGNKQQKKELPKKAIVELREHIQMLNKKRSHLELQIADQDLLARKHIGTNKALAKNALKRKKGYEENLMKIENQIDSLETQLTAIESANLNLETMKAMKQGASAMKQIHGEYDVDKVETTMDDIREQVELADEISEAISRPVGTGYVDEDELDAELAALQAEDQQARELERLPAPKHAAPSAQSSRPVLALPEFPTVSKSQPETQDEEDEDEEALRALQAEMGL